MRLFPLWFVISWGQAVQSKVNEQNVLCFVFYRGVIDTRIHVRAITSQFELTLLEGCLNNWGVNYCIEPNILSRNVIANGT